MGEIIHPWSTVLTKNADASKVLATLPLTGLVSTCAYLQASPDRQTFGGVCQGLWKWQIFFPPTVAVEARLVPASLPLAGGVVPACPLLVSWPANPFPPPFPPGFSLRGFGQSFCQWSVDPQLKHPSSSFRILLFPRFFGRGGPFGGGGALGLLGVMPAFLSWPARPFN